MKIKGNCELVALIHDLVNDDVKVEARVGLEQATLILSVHELEEYEGSGALAKLFGADDLEKIEAFRRTISCDGL